MSLFRPPTIAEERALRRQAAQWQAEARRSPRELAQAALPRGQREVFRIRLVLEGARPAVWRRLLVPADLRLPDLHAVIQRVMGWQNRHPYRFIAGSHRRGLRHYGDARGLDVDLHELAAGRFIDDQQVPITHLLVNEKDWIRYAYDFEDGWMHRLTLEGILLEPLSEARIPRCLAGRRACPPEEVGGILGYEHALQVLADPTHPDHAGLMSWLGRPYDPDAWDAAPVNADLREAFASRSRG